MNPNDNRPGQPQKPQQAPQEMGFDKYVAITLVVGLIAGFIIGHSVGSSGNDKGSDKASSTGSKMIFGDKDEDTSMTPSTQNNDEGIQVSDQEEGNRVVISSLSIDESYWVAIRDNVTGDKIPYILGAKRVAAGSYTDLSIYVNRATVAGKKYDIVFYKDNATFKYDASMLVMNGSTVAAGTFEAK